MKRERIAIVVHRYGKEINGGAEDHCRLLAEHLLYIYSVDILTSCSKDSWDNYYDTGKVVSEGINVIRFAVEDASGYPVNSIERKGPFCPEFKNYIIENHNKYKAVIYITYSHYLSYVGLMQNFHNSIFIPTAHDEKWLRNKIYQDVFHKAKGFLFNSIEERMLIESLFHIQEVPSRTTCFGINVADYDIDIDENENNKYIIYVGRVDNNKNFKEINDYFLRYKERKETALKFLVVGHISDYTSITYHNDIIFRGFVSDTEKKQLLKNAMLLVMPSQMESLSIVLLESFACKRPVLVNGLCDVLREQCKRSKAGLYYTNYFEFENELDYLVENDYIRTRMGNNGYNYVKDNYAWDNVVNNVVSLINEMNGEKIHNLHKPEIECCDDDLIDVKGIVERLRKNVSDETKMSDRDSYIDNLLSMALSFNNIIIVGMGKRGVALKELLSKRCVDSTIHFSDNAPEKYVQSDLEVLSVRESVQLYPDAYFVITPQYHILELAEQLINLGVPLRQMGYYL